jgi:DNA-binding MurR/RpiR family transcriptional regulator
MPRNQRDPTMSPRPAATDKTPASADELRAAILKRHGAMSKRLKQIARYVLDEPNAVALETLAVLAERCGVQPSAIVRFAKSFGFDGATQMQRLFRDGLLARGATLDYAERVREFNKSVEGRAANDPAQVLGEFVEGNLLALTHLRESVDARALSAAVKLIAQADTVYVAGFRRSFPVAAYLAYSLHQVDKKTVFIDGIGGMMQQQAHSIGKDDLLIAVSYHPYAEEAIHLIDGAVDKRCKVLSISDSLVSPVAKPATQVLQVREAEVHKFRSLSASMCLAQSLVIAYALSVSQTRRNPSKLAGRRRNETPVAK